MIMKGVEEQIDWQDIRDLVEEIVEWASTPSPAFIKVNRTMYVMPKNKWFYSHYVSVYMRVGSKLSKPTQLGGELISCLQLATITVEGGFQKKGIFRYIVESLHTLNPLDSMYIENAWCVLHSYLNRSGWDRHITDPNYVQVEDSVDIGSFFRFSPSYKPSKESTLESNHADVWALIAG